MEGVGPGRRKSESQPSDLHVSDLSDEVHLKLDSKFISKMSIKEPEEV